MCEAVVVARVVVVLLVEQVVKGSGDSGGQGGGSGGSGVWEREQMLGHEHYILVIRSHDINSWKFTLLSSQSEHLHNFS